LSLAFVLNSQYFSPALIGLQKCGTAAWWSAWSPNSWNRSYVRPRLYSTILWRIQNFPLWLWYYWNTTLSCNINWIWSNFYIEHL